MSAGMTSARDGRCHLLSSAAAKSIGAGGRQIAEPIRRSPRRLPEEGARTEGADVCKTCWLGRDGTEAGACHGDLGHVGEVRLQDRFGCVNSDCSRQPVVYEDTGGSGRRRNYF